MTDEKCTNLASIRRFWPGRGPDLICVLHAEDSQKVASALGVSLYIEAIGYGVGAPVPKEFPTCSCNKGFSTTVQIKSSNEN